MGAFASLELIILSEISSMLSLVSNNRAFGCFGARRRAICPDAESELLILCLSDIYSKRSLWPTGRRATELPVDVPLFRVGLFVKCILVVAVIEVQCGVAIVVIICYLISVIRQARYQMIIEEKHGDLVGLLMKLCVNMRLL